MKLSERMRIIDNTPESVMPRWIHQRISEWRKEVAQLEDEKYCYEDELPCNITTELFEASIVDGVRLYPWKAVAAALKSENDRLKLE